ncbi:MAG: Ig-like domain-containing protein, partial [Bacteroidota bacterium]|nr:Ig-like domain-containing protein [Bacteroidota bacterium]
MNSRWAFTLFFLVGLAFFSCKKSQSPEYGTLQLQSVKEGSTTLQLQGTNKDIPADSTLTLAFSAAVNTETVKAAISILKNDNTSLAFTPKYSASHSVITLIFPSKLDYAATYTLRVSSALRGADEETFAGTSITFTTANGTLLIKSITINGKDLSLNHHPSGISYQSINTQIVFSEELDSSNYSRFIILSGTGNPSYSLSLSLDKKTVNLVNSSPLTDYSQYYLVVSSNLTSRKGYSFNGFANYFYTALDSSYKFPPLTDDALLTLIQQQTFKYFYDFAHPDCGMARERNTSGDIVATGGTGFGVMALIVGIERGFITRPEGLARLDKILTFLET